PAGINGTTVIESQKAYMGDVQFTAPDSAGFMKGATVTFAAIDSAGTGTAPGSTSLYWGMSLPTPVTALKLGACFDYLDIHNDTAANKSNDSVWNIALYSSFQATDKLSFNFRAEYLDAEDLGNIAGPASLVFSNPVYDQNTAEEFTATAQYNLWANVISRVEFRWDHLDHGAVGVPGNVQGFGAGNGRRNDFLFALNLIYQF
ncbi:MAG TPA: outer membrane beta-barrel protein, partial [Candidatus Saccharimonadales bacterium]|nr:outer membrane beta-barrel protein [Candidatus Saccharimonadales bacterium]